jgi:signal transduction histidine kinase
MDADFLQHGPWGMAWLRPEQLLGSDGLDNLTHSLFWSLLANVGLCRGGVAGAAAAARPRPARRCCSSTCSSGRPAPARCSGAAAPAPGPAGTVGALPRRRRAQRCSADARAPRRRPASTARSAPTRSLVQFVETQLAGAIGSASARVMVASVVQEESAGRRAAILDEVAMRIAGARGARSSGHRELRAANEQLKSLDRLKDDFMSSVTHELRTPLTSIRALAELMRRRCRHARPQRQQFLGIVVAETERLSRLVNQVLDMAKIESGHAEWHNAERRPGGPAGQAVQTTAELFASAAPSCTCVARPVPDRCAPTPTGCCRWC